MFRIDPRSRAVLTLAVVLTLAASVVPASPSIDPAGLVSEIDLPTTVGRVWARNHSKKGMGDLGVSVEGLDFQGGKEKRSFSIPFASIRLLSFGRLGHDVDTDWVVLEVEEAGETRLVGLRDGRKFGFGKETDELHALLKRVFQQTRAAQYDVKPGMATYDALDNLLTLAVPEEWTPFDRSRIHLDGYPDLGRLLLTAERISAGRERKDETQSDLKRFDAGEIRGMFVDRREPTSGMRCDGFSTKAQAAALDWFREDLRSNGGWTILGEPRVEVTSLGKCQGLRISAEARNDAGEPMEIDHRLAARPEAVVTLGFTLPGKGRDALRRTVTEIVESFRFTVARTGRGK